MSLGKSQRAIWEKARALGSGGQAVRLSDGACSYLIARIVKDLQLEDEFVEFSGDVAEFFTADDLSSLSIDHPKPLELYEKLVEICPDGDMYFACLSTLHKARLKYEVILENQPMPTLEQVGPRGLIQYGKLSAPALIGFLYWRKWFFDIDNRAGQETGYLFEPVIANAVGGTPVSAARSPVKRHRDNRKGRQVDCLLGQRAYELKIRMTIAASGQGRWGEELDFPIDCRESGFDPVLLVLDSTPNPKLTELTKAFLAQKGEVYVGKSAWEHLDELAGATMASFLDKYVRAPLENFVDVSPTHLPDFSARLIDNQMILSISHEELIISRNEEAIDVEEHDKLPDEAKDIDL